MGSSVVEGMLSRTAPVFYGDLRSHERVFLYYFSVVMELPMGCSLCSH